MRKEVFLLLVIFLVGFVSASYECSTNFVEEKKEIGILSSSTINSLEIGIINTYSSEGIGVYYVNLMIDGERFELTDEDNSSSFDIQNGEDIIILLNSTEEDAKVEIDGDSEEILENEMEEVKGYQVYITDLQGIFPGNAEVGGFVGQEKITLDQNTKAKKVTVEESEYVVEIFSVTSDSAIITVKTCNGTISEVEDIEEPENNTNVENETITTNETVVINDTENEEPNETISVDINNSNEVVGDIENNQEDEKGNVGKIFFAIIIGLVVIGIIVFLIIKVYCSTREGKSKIYSSNGAPNQGNQIDNSQNNIQQ